MSEIKFGTDGWRAIVGESFNGGNLNKVINAVARYTDEQSGISKKIIIGYDPRNKADYYAEYTAKKLAKSGFDIELCDKITATPVIAYSAFKRNAYALMFTASHNPPEYLGVKFIPPYGGPAEDDTVKIITDYLDIPFESKYDEKEYKTVSFDEDYVNHIKTLIDFEMIQKSGLKINYDGHHGAAGKLFVNILKTYNIGNNNQNLERDITFGGQMPDPKEKYLKSLKELCLKTSLTGLSNDGDGDRFGVFDEKGNFIKADDIIAMLLKHLVVNKNYTGKLATTVGASSITALYAQKLGIDIIETPVGFKWLGAAMRNDDVIIAGEDSGGLSIKGHIPEKDGILANLLIMEMIAAQNKPLYIMHEEFLKEVNRLFLNDRIDLKLDNDFLKDEIINKFKQYENIGKYKITRKNPIDGLKLYLDDSSTVLIRKSGTEPLLRIYLETDKEEKMLELKDNIKQLC